MIIAIDGPAGAGKSTIAKRLAQALNISYLDTGAMYRALTFKALRARINLEDEEQLVQLADQTSLRLEPSPQGVKVFLDNEDVSEAIRTAVVTNNTFYIARAPRVREIMVQWQREMGNRSSVVAEGRDVGTVIFPQATKKFYLDASLDERARRRLKDFLDKGEEVDIDQVKADLEERDQKDFSRSVGALKKADDAILINSTQLSIDEVIQKMLDLIQAQTKKTI